jgi:hypothetical protein
MQGFPVTCSNCGHPLRDVHDTPCPNCGHTGRTVHLAALAHVKASAGVSMSIQRVTEEIRKNWPLIVVLVVCDLISMIPAYFLNGWKSVGTTVFFILLSTAIGYFAITRVITITKE